MLIINADDFGLDGQTNKAIVESFKRGLCSSTTLMPNMPGFGEACQLAHENRLIRHVGMHLVLRDGYPLTEGIRHISRLCDGDGRLCLSRKGPIPILTMESREKEAIAEEIRAQIRRCRDYGIPITHIDSHYHIHTEWAVASVLIVVAREEGIPYVRIARNCGTDLGPLKRVYKYALNYRFRAANLARTDYFGSVEDFVSLKNKMGSESTIKSLEVMIHPCFNERDILIDNMSGVALEEAVRKIDSLEDAVSFGGVKFLKG